MKQFLISITSNCEGLAENYLRTLPNLDDSVETIMIQFQPFFDANVDKIFKIDTPYVGNLNRFKYFPKGFEDEDIIIFTDASDVIFQKPIPELGQIIYVAPEYDTWGDDNWWKEKLSLYNYHGLDGFPIYCMGTWAMPYKLVKDLLDFLDKNAGMFGHSQFSDQILFNIWLKDKDYMQRSDLMASLYSGYHFGKVIKTDKGFVNHAGNLISIVHANGNLKYLLVNKQL